jgi:hypothetical protein
MQGQAIRRWQERKLHQDTVYRSDSKMSNSLDAKMFTYKFLLKLLYLREDRGETRNASGIPDVSLEYELTGSKCDQSICVILVTEKELRTGAVRCSHEGKCDHFYWNTHLILYRPRTCDPRVICTML